MRLPETITLGAGVSSFNTPLGPLLRPYLWHKIQPAPLGSLLLFHGARYSQRLIAIFEAYVFCNPREIL